MQLSRTWDAGDLPRLDAVLTRRVDPYAPPGGLSPAERWSYALALHAVIQWSATARALHDPLYDVGGADARFFLMLHTETGRRVEILDPVVRRPLAAACIGGAQLADVITALSLLEHVEDVDQTLYHLTCLLAPGGLLVLTFAYWNRCGADLAVGRERRRRIFCPKTYAGLRLQLKALGCEPFGGLDPLYHGPQVQDHTRASLVVVKRG